MTKPFVNRLALRGQGVRPANKQTRIPSNQPRIEIVKGGLAVIPEAEQKDFVPKDAAAAWRQRLADKPEAKGGPKQPDYMTGKGGMTPSQLKKPARLSLASVKGSEAGEKSVVNGTGGQVVKAKPIKPKRKKKLVYVEVDHYGLKK